ncbi:MAG: efflux RND transporter periplasmic adaptor subunit [bacterium]
MIRTNKSFGRLVGVACVVAAMFLVGCGRKEAGETSPVVRPVKTMMVGGIISGELRFPATVEAGEKALLSFRVPGRLIELPVDEGMTVKSGQLIARLDPEDFQIAIDEAEANFTKASSDYKRYQQLYEKNAVPLAELEQRRSQRDVTKARLDEAKRNLGYTYLRAPFDGQIGRRYVENFMDVRPNEEIVDLNDVRNVEIIFDVAENLIKGIRAGWTVEAFALFDAAPGKRYPLTRKEIATRADAATQTFKVTYEMPQPEDFLLLPGMTAEALVVLTATEEAAESERITIPAIAVMGDAENNAYVWLVDPEKMTVHKRVVDMGPVTGTTDIVVREGLQTGDIVVIAGVTELQEGMEVRLWENQD